MAAEGIGSGSAGIAFLVSAGIVAELTAKACSSPQTVEINAGTRADTLMKWVNIGMIEGAVFVAIAVMLDDRMRWPFILGGAAEIAVTYAEYIHAKRSGLRNAGPSTETTGSGGGWRG